MMSLPGALGVAELTRVTEAGGDLQLPEGTAGLRAEQRDVARMGRKSKETKRDYMTRAAHVETPQLPLQALRSVMDLLRSR